MWLDPYPVQYVHTHTHTVKDNHTPVAHGSTCT